MRILLALALAASSTIAAAAPAPTPPGDAKVAIAKLDVQRYAYEAFPQWATVHPEIACPARLADLEEYMSRSGPDPWGHAYRMYCGKTLPPGAKYFAVSSDGPDGRRGTADDITSWTLP